MIPTTKASVYAIILLHCASPRCDIPLPPEPLEVRIAFHGNEDSELALVLSLDVPHGTGERREIVLRGWGKEVR